MTKPLSWLLMAIFLCGAMCEGVDAYLNTPIIGWAWWYHLGFMMCLIFFATEEFIKILDAKLKKLRQDEENK